MVIDLQPKIADNCSMDCPICECSSQRLRDLCALIDGPALLVTLLCDFAERVAWAAPDPDMAKRWLKAARDWQNGHELDTSEIDAQEAESGQAYLATNAVSWAITAA